MTVLLIILAILIFLNILPIGARVIYDESGVRVRAVLGLIQFQVVPGKPKEPKDPEAEAEEKRKKKKEKAEKKAKKEQKPKKPKKYKPKQPLGVTIQEFLPFIRLGLEALGDLRWIFTIHKLNLDVTYGGSDAGKVAMNYGMICGILGTALPMLTGALRIRRYDVRPVLDYNCKDVRIVADACVTITLGRVMLYLIRYGWKALKLWRNKKRKGGATV